MTSTQDVAKSLGIPDSDVEVIMTDIKRHDFFKQTAPLEGGLIVPEMAIFCRNDCKEGKWMIGETDYGPQLEFFILKFSRRISEYMGEKIPQGQIWFTPVSGDVPAGIVYYTLIKNSRSGRSGSMRNFGQQVAIAQSQGYDPREVIWQPKFIKKSGAVPDENGELQSATWYVMDWSFRPVSSEQEFQTLDNLVAILTNPEQEVLMFDLDLENSSICVDGMSHSEILRLLRETPEPVEVTPSRVLSPAE
jgi:hypothetical protein